MTSNQSLRFVPSRVAGLSDVREVAIYPDRLELDSAAEIRVFNFADIARWPRPAWLWRMLSRLGWRPKWLPVADRDWFHPPADRFFVFYTTPQIVLFMPTNE